MPSTAIRITFKSFLLLLICTNLVSAETDETIVSLSTTFWLHILAIGALITCSGIVAGLTLGLLSQDATNLAIISAAGTPQQRKYASRIIPIRKNGHLLLTSLLLTNTVLNETLPILCDSLFGKGRVKILTIRKRGKSDVL
ncbi:hypothetical protein BX666DRAFT_1970143 [Dichotomocladium elegans]|nr:hypothetical protein BX666DRAFT_1970143 [Dichotomocladium elegans]